MGCPHCGHGDPYEWSPGFMQCTGRKVVTLQPDWQPVVHGAWGPDVHFDEAVTVPCEWRWYEPRFAGDLRPRCACGWGADARCARCDTPVCQRHGTFVKGQPVLCADDVPGPLRILRGTAPASGPAASDLARRRHRRRR